MGKMLYLFDNKLKRVVAAYPIVVSEPYKVAFTKDRKTKKRYLFVQTANSDPFDETTIQRFETQYCQYDDVSIDIR